MSNARLDGIFDATRQNMIEEYGEDAVNRATQYLKDRGYLWWDYWNYEDSGQSNLPQSEYDEVRRILATKSTKKSKFIRKNKGFEVEAGRWNLRFNHSDNEGMTQWGPIQAYYLDSQFGEGDIGITYGMAEDGSVYHADFMCYGNSPSHYALRDGDSIGLNFNSEEDMIEAFKKWLKSLEIPMDEDGNIMESAKKSKSFSEMVKSQRAGNIRKDVGPQITANADQLDNIAYMADAICFEMESVSDGLNTKYPSEIEFYCSPDEYYQKIVECKKMVDWLTGNISFWTFH